MLSEIKFLTFLFVPFSFFSQQFANERNELLWEISGNGLKEKSYLFGSFHTNDKRVFDMSDSTYVALTKAKAIVLEVDLQQVYTNWDPRRNEVRLRFDNDGKPYTSSKEATLTSYGDEDGMPQFLDAFFQDYSYKSNKLFYPLETMDDQMNVYDDLPAIKSNRYRIENFIVSQENIMNVYLKGDIVGIDRLMRSSLSVYPGLYQKMIVDRNNKMAAGLDTLMRKSSVFCAVGAGHLAGDNGIIVILRNKGYKVRLVEYTKTNSLEKAVVRGTKIYNYRDEAIGLTANFPGKPVLDSNWIGNSYLIYREMGQGNTYQIEWTEKEPDMELDDYGLMYIASPVQSKISRFTLDDGTEVIEGLSDSYPEGLSWVRVIMSDNYVFVLKAYGGNKFMNSGRAQRFFNGVVLQH